MVTEQDMKEYVTKELKRIPGVKNVEISTQVNVMITINDFSNRDLRNEVYDMESKIMQQLDYGFNFTIKE